MTTHTNLKIVFREKISKTCGLRGQNFKKGILTSSKLASYLKKYTLPVNLSHKNEKFSRHNKINCSCYLLNYCEKTIFYVRGVPLLSDLDHHVD